MKNCIFENWASTRFGFINGDHRVHDCVSVGVFSGDSALCASSSKEYVDISRCYALLLGPSKVIRGFSNGGVYGLHDSFFCGTSTVTISSSNGGCIGGHECYIRGGCAANFIGRMPFGTSSSQSLTGGLYGRVRNNYGAGHYVCGDFGMNYGGGLVDALGSFMNECYYANKGHLEGGTRESDVAKGYLNTTSGTAFKQFLGSFNAEYPSSDIFASGGALYSYDANLWWAPWIIDLNYPAFLKSTPHFIPIESSTPYEDVAGTI